MVFRSILQGILASFTSDCGRVVEVAFVPVSFGAVDARVVESSVLRLGMVAK